MKLALEIINREIAQRELANKHDHLRKEICTKEIEGLKKVVNLLSIQNVSDQRELLILFAKYLQNQWLSVNAETADNMVDSFINSR